MKTSNPYGPCCPFCSHVNGFMLEISEPRMNCTKCGEEFVCWSETDVTYFAIDPAEGRALREILTKEGQGDE